MSIKGQKRSLDMDYKSVLEQIGHEVQPEFGKGQVASYIPALKRVSPRKFGMAICTIGGEQFLLGDAEEPFSIQSVSKVLMLILALRHVGTDLWQRVGREPSGTPFNSLVLLEAEHGKPRNPFINAGALVVTDCIVSHDATALRSVLNMAKNLSGNEAVHYDREVARSEREHGDRNAAIAYFLKSHGNLNADVDEVLEVYFHQCALAMSCLDLARATLPLASGGIAADGVQVMGARRVKRINALMLTCGLYDGVGNFAFRVGIPAKSGVGGGIIAVIPGIMSICVWSPELDGNGNSLVGTRALELFTTKTGLSIF